MIKTLTVLATILILCITGCREGPSIKGELKKAEETAPAVEETMHIGVAAMLSPKETLHVYNEIVEYIGKGLGKKTIMVYTKNYAEMNKMIKDKEIDAAFVCSGPYVKGHDEWGMQLIAAPQMYGEKVYYSYIIVSVESAINIFEDLRGKTFAFTDPISNTGTLAPTYELAKINETPRTFFRTYIFSGTHDKSIEMVARRIVEGAAVDHLIWEFMNAVKPAYTSKTKIIAKLGPFGIPPFVVHPDMDIETKKKLREILLDADKDPEGKAILSKIYIDKFVVPEDNWYDSVRDMEKLLKVVKDEKK